MIVARPRLVATCVAMAAVAGSAGVAAAIVAEPTAGTAGAATYDSQPCDKTVGDRLQPRLGAQGVEVRDYRTHLRFAAAGESYRARTVIRGRVGSDTRCLGLDFAGGGVDTVTVNGDRATARERDGRLVVTPSTTMRAGSAFRVVVRTSTEVLDAADIGPRGFPPGVFSSGGVVQSIGQPTSRVQHLVPMFDHPSQKAPWHITVDTPPVLTAAVSGDLRSTRRTARGSRAVFTTPPIASHVLQVAVGPFARVTQGRVGDVSLRSWVPRGAVAATAKARSAIPRHLRFLERRLGSYPFRSYGVLATPVGGELEHQSLSLLSTEELTKPRDVDAVLVHELVHQWFGDSVSVESWSDLWLAEGHAVYYQVLWSHRQGSPTQSLAERFDERRAEVAEEVARSGPIARPRRGAFPAAIAPYGPAAYQGGALALWDLRREVGNRAFRQIEQEFVRKHHHSFASTDDYLDIVRAVAGQQAADHMADRLL